jgi:hypothetical protein
MRRAHVVSGKVGRRHRRPALLARSDIDAIRLVGRDLLGAFPYVFDIGVRPPKKADTGRDEYRESRTEERFPAAFGLHLQNAGYKQKSADRRDEQQPEEDQGHKHRPDAVVTAANELLPEPQGERCHEQKPTGNCDGGNFAKEESADDKDRQHRKR